MSTLSDYTMIAKKDALLEKIKSNNSHANIKKIERAFIFAHDAHSGQKRASGEDYITHPITVADILCDLSLDTDTIVTALLHDVVEDTYATLPDIQKFFGKRVANLVDGVTKLAKIKYQADHIKQAENFRKLLLAISSDIRVLLVKLADRLHNMRTLYHVQSKEKRLRIANETLDIYAPLAERMGIHIFKNELQDLAFAHAYPDIQSSIKKKLSFLKKDGVYLVDIIAQEIDDLLKKSEIDASVSGREKTPFSIWKKMEKKKIAFEQLVDIVAFRITVSSVEECYRVLGVIHLNYHMVPNGFEDYISTPKQNSYQSIHTIVMGPQNCCIEIQIRTIEMHEIAEMGVAAHWAYKQGSKEVEGKHYKWVRELLDIISNTSCPEEFLENTKLEMVYDQVFCFDHNGALIATPVGSTPVDFAYTLGNEVGNKCIGVKINSHIVPLNTKLQNGDQIEILTSENAQPSQSWESFVVTGRAKSEIRRVMRMRQKQEYANLGKAMILTKLKNASIKYDHIITKKAAKIHGKDSVSEFFAAIGDGSIDRNAALSYMYPEVNQTKLEKKKTPFSIFNRNDKSSNSASQIPISGLMPGFAAKFATCCQPIPNDPIVGMVKIGQGIMIHHQDCKALIDFSTKPEEWLDVSWKECKKYKYIGRICVVIRNVCGMFANIVSIISEHNVNITNIQTISKKDDFFKVTIDMEVSNAAELLTIINFTQMIDGVHSAHRYIQDA